MAAREGSSLSKDELSAKRTIIRENPEGSSQINVSELLSVVIEQVDSCANFSSSSLVSSDEKWFTSIVNAELSAGNNQGAKIPKVRDMLRNVESSKNCYDSVVVSIGPYHHGRPHLQEIEKLKIKLAKQFVADIHAVPQIDLEKVKKLDIQEAKTDIEEVKKLYKKVKKVADDARKYYDHKDNNVKFTRMMFLNCCFILQFMYLLVGEEYHRMGMTNNLIAGVKRDLFLLENQLLTCP